MSPTELSTLHNSISMNITDDGIIESAKWRQRAKKYSFGFK